MSLKSRSLILSPLPITAALLLLWAHKCPASYAGEVGAGPQAAPHPPRLVSMVEKPPSGSNRLSAKDDSDAGMWNGASSPKLDDYTPSDGFRYIRRQSWLSFEVNDNFGETSGIRTLEVEHNNWDPFDVYDALGGERIQATASQHSWLEPSAFWGNGEASSRYMLPEETEEGTYAVGTSHMEVEFEVFRSVEATLEFTLVPRNEGCQADSTDAYMILEGVDYTTRSPAGSAGLEGMYFITEDSSISASFTLEPGRRYTFSAHVSSRVDEPMCNEDGHCAVCAGAWAGGLELNEMEGSSARANDTRRGPTFAEGGIEYQGSIAQDADIEWHAEVEQGADVVQEGNIEHEADVVQEGNIEHEADVEQEGNIEHEADVEQEGNTEHEADVEAKANSAARAGETDSPDGQAGLEVEGSPVLIGEMSSLAPVVRPHIEASASSNATFSVNDAPLPTGDAEPVVVDAPLSEVIAPPETEEEPPPSAGALVPAVETMAQGVEPPGPDEETEVVKMGVVPTVEVVEPGLASTVEVVEPGVAPTTGVARVPMPAAAPSATEAP